MINYQTQPRDTNELDPADLDLISRIGIALTSRQRIAWRVIRVIADQGIVTLQGIVPTYYDRQIIVAVTQHVAGVRRVEDELTIAPPPVRANEADASDNEARSEAQGNSELRAEPQPVSYQQVYQQLPVLSPSLEEILSARAGVSAEG